MNHAVAGMLQVGTAVPYQQPFQQATWQSGISQLLVNCTANQHVFACDHTLTCKCGLSTRQAPHAPVCPHCGAG